MRKIALLLGLLVGCYTAPEAKNPSDVVSDKTSVLLVSKQDNNVVPLCKAIWVSEDLLLSSAQCVNSCSIPYYWDELVNGPWVSVGSKVSYAFRRDIDANRNFKINRSATVLVVSEKDNLALLRAYSNSLASHNISTSFEGMNKEAVNSFLNKNKKLFNLTFYY